MGLKGSRKKRSVNKQTQIALEINYIFLFTHFLMSIVNMFVSTLFLISLRFWETSQVPPPPPLPTPAYTNVTTSLLI